MVVPGLPPTGAAGVGSLNPSPGPSRLTMVMVEALAAAVASVSAITMTRASRANRPFRGLIAPPDPPGRGWGGRGAPPHRDPPRLPTPGVRWLRDAPPPTP